MQVGGKGGDWGLQGSMVRGNNPRGAASSTPNRSVLVGVERRVSLNAWEVKPSGLGLRLEWVRASQESGLSVSGLGLGHWRCPY